MRPSVQATKASIENINLINSGRGEVAFTLGDSLRDAYEGNEAAGFKKKLTNLSTLAAIYPNYVQIVASKESGIKTLADLKGKRLSVGAPKSGTELNARTILEAAGLSYDDLGKIEYLPFAESVELMKTASWMQLCNLPDLASPRCVILPTRWTSMLLKFPQTSSRKLGRLIRSIRFRRIPIVGRTRTS